MATTTTKPDLNRKGDIPHSKLDLLSGKHTMSIIVAILFLVTLMCFVILYCVKPTLPDNIITGLFGLLGALAGFFAGANIKKD
jgi:heme O synthase-like polyprenyltransferase